VAPESALLRLLRYVPDTPVYRELVLYGDVEAWHQSWAIPRVDSMKELEALGREPYAYWRSIMSLQVGSTDLFQESVLKDYRRYYGFDLFTTDRFIESGEPPAQITIAELRADRAQIGTALTATGYTSATLTGGETLYSLNADYAMNLKADLPTRGKLGALNRIALSDNRLVVGRATGLITETLQAGRGLSASLADNPAFFAAATALADPGLTQDGELVGAVFVDAAKITPARMAGSVDVTAQLAEYAQGPGLPAFTLAAFGTRHSKGASHLLLAVVFPKETDARAAANVLAERLKSYSSIRKGMQLKDHWTYEMATAREAGGLPVALVVMRVSDPPPTPENEPRVNAFVVPWFQIVFNLDLLFLTTTGQ
jgi:hypothetical protein